jgi:hypothetical protein
MGTSKTARKKARRRQDTLGQLRQRNPQAYEQRLQELFGSWELELSRRISMICPAPRASDAEALLDTVRETYQYVAQQVGPEEARRFERHSRRRVVELIVALVRAGAQENDLAETVKFGEAVRRGDATLWADAREALRPWLDSALEAETSRRAGSLWAKATGLAELATLVDASDAEGAVRDHVNKAVQKAARPGRIPLYATVNE